LTLDKKKRLDLMQAVVKRHNKIHNLTEGITLDGLVKYETYTDKLAMMDTPLFKLDMKLYKQQGNITFFDADFANVLMVRSQFFEEKTFRDACNVINHTLST
jgi:hypothetical protein